MQVENKLKKQIEIPSLPEMVELIKEAGSSVEWFFGYPVKENGLYLQQDPEEFAAFVHFMATHVGSAELSLDLGIASGGQTKFLRDWFKCKRTIILDNGEHEHFHRWERIKKLVDTEFELEMISDSHLPEVREKLQPYQNKIDFAFVDGDHSYKGLRQDIFLVTPLLRDGGILALHDTAAVWDCKKVFDDLIKSPNYVLLRNYDNRFGISLWQRLPRRKPTKWRNHTFAWGRL